MNTNWRMDNSRVRWLIQAILIFGVSFGHGPMPVPAQTAVAPAVRPQAPDVFVPADYPETKYTGYLGRRMALNVEQRLLTLNVDTLLRPFQQRSGGQWWLGEHAGKYIHAATYAWRFTGNEALKARLDDAVRKLIAAQLPNGYLGTYPEKDRFIERDGLSWDGPVWDVWAHKYGLIGLLTYYQATGNQPALQAGQKAADLLCHTFGPDKKSIVRASSHVGMASTSVLEPMAVLYGLTGEKRYLDFCHYLIAAWKQPPAPNLLESLLEHGNVYKTANNKAYEMLSNLVGLMELYRLEGDPRYLQACQAAWEDIHRRRLYPVGTTSYAEHFTDDSVLPSEARTGDSEPKIGEGCVTVTWLQLTMRLLHATGAPRYASALERTIYNALPAAQSPHAGQVCYFLPVNGRRRYGEVSHGLPPDISCCSSSVPRGLALIPELVAGSLHGHPALLQYEAGAHRVTARVDGASVPVELLVRTDYPASGRIQIEVRPPRAARFPLLLRVPEWAEAFAATVGETRHQGVPGEMLRIAREWIPGDVVEIAIPMKIQSHPDPDKDSDKIWLRRGPQVLAQDEQVSQNGGLPAGWWGGQIYPVTGKRNGAEVRLLLVPFAEAGQNKQPYATLFDAFDLERQAGASASSAREIPARRLEGHPADHLPPHITQLTWFGERPDWRADGKRFVFLSKVFGDVYEYELATGRIFPCTDHFKHFGFTRAQYLVNGDLLLSGPVAPFNPLDKEDRQRARSSCYLSVLAKGFAKPPMPLDVHCDEGPAVSRSRLRLAWTHGKQDRISVGDLEYAGSVPALVNRRQVLSVQDFPPGQRPQRWIETQDFVPPGERQLTVTAYEVNGGADTETYLFDLETRALVNLSKSPDTYDEAEGIFPDGRFTTIERAPHRGNPWPLIDIYQLALDGSGRLERLIFFTDYRGYKSDQSVISLDGRFMLFGLGKSGTEAGQGYGIFLYDFSKANGE